MRAKDIITEITSGASREEDIQNYLHVMSLLKKEPQTTTINGTFNLMCLDDGEKIDYGLFDGDIPTALLQVATPEMSRYDFDSILFTYSSRSTVTRADVTITAMTIQNSSPPNGKSSIFCSFKCLRFMRNQTYFTSRLPQHPDLHLDYNIDRGKLKLPVLRRNYVLDIFPLVENSLHSIMPFKYEDSFLIIQGNFLNV